MRKMKNGFVVILLALCGCARAEPKVPEIRIKAPKQDAAKVFKVPAPSGGDHWPGVKAVLDKAIAAGPDAKVIFGKGTYDLSDYKYIADGWHINLRDVKDMIIDGSGATFKMHPSNSFLSLHNCKRVVVKNFTLNYTMPHHMQGDVVEVAAGGETLVVKPHSGYPYAADFPKKEKLPVLKNVSFVIDPQTRELMRLSKLGNCHIKSTKTEIIADESLIRYHIDHRYQKAAQNIAVGDIFITLTFFNGNKENMLVRRSSDCVLEDITAHSGAGMNIRPANNEGPIAMRKIINKPRPGSNNIVATIRDGMHCRSNRGPMLIEECYFESMMDDSINIFSLGFACGKLTDDGGLFVQRTGGGEPIDYFRPGDKTVLLDRTSGNYLAEMTVKKTVPQFKNSHDMEKTNRFFTLYFEEELPAGIVYGKPDGRSATEVYNLSACGAGSVVRKNTFMPQRRHAMLCKPIRLQNCKNITLTNNTFDTSNKDFQ